MILHKLIAHHIKRRDDAAFYAMQAMDAIRWIEAAGVNLAPGVSALDLGCGHGVFGAELAKRGCAVTFSDDHNWLVPALKDAPFRPFNIDRDDFATLGQFDLVVCSNVLEHLPRPADFIARMHTLLRPGGRFYLSWTPWLSPWGGHEFSPLHYLGVTRGHRIHDWLGRAKRIHTPFENLFPTSIGGTLRWIRVQPHLRLERAAPRYFTELEFLVHVPILREFAAWNCALLLSRKD
jgi:SAM-dependent methyltransferase